MKFRCASLIVSFCLLFSASYLNAQNPVKWSFTTQDLGNGQANLIFTGIIDDGWSTYSQVSESDMGPLPTTITFKDGAHYSLIGKAAESGDRVTAFDKVFGINLTKFKHKAIFTQKVSIKDYTKPIEGYISFMVCDDEMCLPPKDVDFKFKVTPANAAPTPTTPPATKPEEGGQAPPATNGNGGTPGTAAIDAGTTPIVNAPPATDTPTDPEFKGFFDSKRAAINAAQFVNSCEAPEEDHSSLFWTFLVGFVFGLGAVLTPCIFPMIPVTVGFFVKRSKDRATGLRNAFLYGFSIWAIYVALGIGVTTAFGPTALNEMSTNVLFNVFFFLVFLVFAISFFGFFEITLPASWVNGSDELANKGGIVGIFFMAFTLALVSFSCTGPLVGSLLVETSRANAGQTVFGAIPARPFAGLSGFGLALALPFALFAMFPSWLKSLPKSGGWMDNVKITLGFVEVALAFKFLSTADMVAHWNILKFEAFMGIWLLCAGLMTLYQFGILGWKGAQGRPGLVRIGMGALAGTFAIYLAYGLFNYKSLSLLSGLAPPVGYSWGHPSSCPQGIDCYHDFDEALAVAKLENKPLFVDFTGYGCVNCRQMEETIWPLPGIIERLRNDYIVVSLYVDDKARLFPDNKFDYLLDRGTGDKMRTVGDKWSSFEINNFNRNSQPWYVLMNNDGTTVLTEPRGHTPEAKKYKAFLDCGLDAFHSLQGKKVGEALGTTN